MNMKLRSNIVKSAGRIINQMQGPQRRSPLNAIRNPDKNNRAGEHPHVQEDHHTEFRAILNKVWQQGFMTPQENVRLHQWQSELRQKEMMMYGKKDPAQIQLSKTLTNLSQAFKVLKVKYLPSCQGITSNEMAKYESYLKVVKLYGYPQPIQVAKLKEMQETIIPNHMTNRNLRSRAEALLSEIQEILNGVNPQKPPRLRRSRTLASPIRLQQHETSPNNKRPLSSHHDNQFDNRPDKEQSIQSSPTPQVTQIKKQVDFSYQWEKREDRSLCKICLERQREYTTIPCGHYIYCEKCSKLVKDTCLYCRQQVTHVIKIYD